MPGCLFMFFCLFQLLMKLFLRDFKTETGFLRQGQIQIIARNTCVPTMEKNTFG